LTETVIHWVGVIAVWDTTQKSQSHVLSQSAIV